MGLVITSDMIFFCLQVPWTSRTAGPVCMCVSAAQWNVIKSPQGADSGGHRSGLCLRGHHPHRLGVCGVSEVSEYTHRLRHTFKGGEPNFLFPHVLPQKY